MSEKDVHPVHHMDMVEWLLMLSTVNLHDFVKIRIKSGHSMLVIWGKFETNLSWAIWSH